MFFKKVLPVVLLACLGAVVLVFSFFIVTAPRPASAEGISLANLEAQVAELTRLVSSLQKSCASAVSAALYARGIYTTSAPRV